MILYLSSLLDDDTFAGYVKTGCISGGHQAQKFNSLIARGLTCFTTVSAISNPPYNLDHGNISAVTIQKNNIKYRSIGSNISILHKVDNYNEMQRLIKDVIEEEPIEAIVCDAINPLASLNAISFARKKNVPSIAIITDIPEYMDKGKKNLFTVLTAHLMKQYDGYVLLTEAMNILVNSHKKPYIVMEGLCENLETNFCSLRNKQVDNKFVCVYTGSLNAGTGIVELVLAIEFLKEHNVELRIYGNGNLVDWIREREKKDSRIKYLGVVTNAEAVRAQEAADLLINPRPDNIAYGNLSFPSKVMEYMASGTPLLTTKLPGIPKEYFEYLYTIDDCSSEGIAKAISNVIYKTSNERLELGKRAQDFVLSEKNNEKQAERIMALIRKIKDER